MKPEIIALISALGGILIGQIGSIIISLITKRLEHKGEMRKLIVSTGTEEWKEAFKLAHKRSGRIAVYPLSAFIIYNAMVVDLIDKGKKIKEKEVREIHEKMEMVSEVIEEFDKLAKGEKKERQPN